MKGFRLIEDMKIGWIAKYLFMASKDSWWAVSYLNSSSALSFKSRLNAGTLPAQLDMNRRIKLTENVALPSC